MTMVPAPKLSKPHLIFYGGCGGSEVMSRFGDGCNNNNINGNNNAVTTTTADNINKLDTNLNNNKVISGVLGSDLGIGRHHHHHHPNNIIMADEQQQSRNSNNSVNNDTVNKGQARDDDRDTTPTPTPPPPHQERYLRDDVIDSSSWLQLGLGGGGAGTGTHLNSTSPHQAESTAATSGGGGLMLELNLGGVHNHQTTPFQMPELESVRVPQIPHDVGVGVGPTTFIPPHHHHHHHLLISSLSQQSQLYLHHQQLQQQQQQQQQQIGWGFINQRTALSASMSPSSSSSIPPQQMLLPGQGGGVVPFLARPFTPSGSSVDAPDSEFRLIHPPPRRPHSGIWFSLHASPHQSKEPFLPQLPKNFLRIKDGRMTVRLVMKYVANKLGLDSESEVEIRCRGQQLVPYLTLQHVRDNIWSPREAEAMTVTLLPDSSTSDHVMVLNYGRTTTTIISSSAYFS